MRNYFSMLAPLVLLTAGCVSIGNDGSTDVNAQPHLAHPGPR